MKHFKPGISSVFVFMTLSAVLAGAAMFFAPSRSAGVETKPSSAAAKSEKAAGGVVLKVGDKAPAIELKDQNGKLVTLDNFRDKDLTLIAFYPKDDSPVCSIEMKAFSRDYEKFSGLNVQIVGISVDSVKSHGAFANKHGLQFVLLSDRTAKVSKAYGAYLEQMRISNRAYFIVDKAGVIRYALVEKSPAMREDNDSLLKVVKNILSEDKGKATPAATRKK